MKKNSLKNVLIILSVILLIVTSIGMIMFNKVNNGYIEDQTFSTLNNSADEQSKMLKMKFDSMYTLLEAFSNSLSSQNIFDSEKILGRMGAICETGEFINVCYITPDGIMTTDKNIDLYVGDRDYFTVAMNGNRKLCYLKNDRIDDTEVFVISVPVQNSSGSIVGVVCAAYDSKTVCNMMTSGSFGGNGYSYICDSTGEIIAKSNDNRAKIKSSNLFNYINEHDSKGFNIDEIKSKAKNNENGLVEYKIDSSRKYAVYKPLNINNWYIVNITPAEFVNRQSRSIIISGFVLAAVIIITSLISTICLILRERSINKILEKQRISMMMSQIKPHFLYNTLSAIRAYISIEPKTAEQMVYNFSKYLRANIDILSNDELVDISKELEHVKAYCEIEKVRFSGRVNVVYDIESKDFLVPPLSIQPIVENAIKHGICKKNEGGTVYISTREDENNYYITVDDDGIGFDTEKRAKDTSAGMNNIKYRIKTMAKGTVEVNSEVGVGSTVTVTVPKNFEVKHNEDNNG